MNVIVIFKGEVITSLLIAFFKNNLESLHTFKNYILFVVLHRTEKKDEIQIKDK